MQSYLTKFIGKSGQSGLAAVDQSILGQAPSDNPQITINRENTNRDGNRW